MTERNHHRAPPFVGEHRRGDVVTLVLGTVGLVLLSALAVRSDDVSRLEIEVFRAINDLPDVLEPAVWTVMQIGALGIPVVVGLAALAVPAARRRWGVRLPADVIAASVGVWFIARRIKELVERPRPDGLLDDLTRVTTDGRDGYPSGHAAVSAALVFALAPHLPARWRPVVWAIPWIVGAGRLYYGAHLPLDIVGGVALGWIGAVAIRVALGRPRQPVAAADHPDEPVPGQPHPGHAHPGQAHPDQSAASS